MAARAKAIFGESQELDAVRLLMFVYIAMYADEATARAVSTFPPDEIRQRFRLLAKTFSDTATDAEATISSIESWSFGSQLPLLKLCEQLETLEQPRFGGDVVQAYYKWDEMRLAAGGFLDPELESACVGVGQSLSFLATLTSKADEMITSLRLKIVQATANMLCRGEPVGHDISAKVPPGRTQMTQGKTRKNTPVVFEDWELVAILTLPSIMIRVGGIAAELTTFRSLYYRASCFLERPLIHDREFVIAVHETTHLEYDKLAQIMGKLTTQTQRSITSLQYLLKMPWSFHASLQWQFDSLAKHDFQLQTTLYRAKRLFLDWQAAMKTITNPLLRGAAADLGREIIAFKLALSGVDARHQEIRRKADGLWVIRQEFIQGKIDVDGVREKMGGVLSAEELQGAVKIHYTVIRTTQSQGCNTSAPCFMSEACLNNLTNPQHELRELEDPNFMTPAEAMAALLGQSQNRKPDPAKDLTELQRIYEQNADVYHYLFPEAEKPEFARHASNATAPPNNQGDFVAKKRVQWKHSEEESDPEPEAEPDGEYDESDEKSDTYDKSSLGSEIGWELAEASHESVGSDTPHR